MKKKTIILIFSGFGMLLLAIWEIIGNFKLCGSVWGNCVEILAEVEIILFPIAPLFVFSLITYKMREEIFEIWWKFARIFIPLIMLAVYIAPSYPSNSYFPIEGEGSVLLYFCLNFIISSTLLIISKYKSLKNNLRYSNKSIAWIIAFSSIISIFAWYSLLTIV
jgi:hypothetical protein